MAQLGRDVLPQIFKEIGTELVSVIRTTQANDEYGGSADTENTIFEGIPATYKPIGGNARFVQGGEWTMHEITMPTIFGGEEIALRPTDKLLMAERAVSSPERLFVIESIRNKSGVVYEVICSLKE